MGSRFMRKLKVGYWPLSQSMNSAGDRRRLVFWATARGHTIVTDLNERVDIVVASENSDFNSSFFSKTRTPIIFDLVDAYLSPLNTYDDYARGIAKKASRQISGGIKPFSRHISDFCEQASAVICSSIEQEEIIKKYNPNIHVILDSHDEIPYIDAKIPKTSISSGHRILWEGQPATIRGVGKISSVLSRLLLCNSLEIDFVTDEKYFKFLNKYAEKDTFDLLKKDLSKIASSINILPWTPENLLARAKDCTIAMIPIDLTVPMQRLKPENRLLIMWRLGLPCLTSSSPAYTRVAEKAGVTVVCEDLDTWVENFQHVLDDPIFAQEEAVRGQSYLLENHTRAILLKKWDKVIESVIG